MKNFRFNTICNITQEPQELQRYNRVCRFIGKSAVIKCHQLLSKVTCMNRRLRPDSNRYLVSLSLKVFYSKYVICNGKAALLPLLIRPL